MGFTRGGYKWTTLTSWPSYFSILVCSQSAEEVSVCGGQETGDKRRW